MSKNFSVCDARDATAPAQDRCVIKQEKQGIRDGGGGERKKEDFDV